MFLDVCAKDTCGPKFFFFILFFSTQQKLSEATKKKNSKQLDSLRISPRNIFFDRIYHFIYRDNYHNFLLYKPYNIKLILEQIKNKVLAVDE